MAGIKRKSAAAAQPEVKAKSKKVKVDKPAKRSSDNGATKKAKSSKKAKRDEDSDELMESDTSEVENGFYGFSAKEAADEEDSADEDGFVGDALDAALDDEAKKDRKKDKKQPKNSSTAEEKSSALAGLNGKHREPCVTASCLSIDQPPRPEKPMPNRKHWRKSAKRQSPMRRSSNN